MTLSEVLQVEDVSKSFGETRALQKVSFTIKGPQIIAILGPNGAGKTTLLEILEGLTAQDTGKVQLFGAPLDRSRYPKQRVGVVMQREFVFEGVSVSEYAALFSAIYRIQEGADKIIKRARLEPRSNTRVSKLSGGEQQRLFIAAAVVHSPSLLFLDEPSAHLDPASKRELWEWLLQLKDCTILLTTHDLREAESLCRSVLFLVRGEVKAFGEKEELISKVPKGKSLEDAFFYFCDSRLHHTGELE
jgi:ABC-2 type transport system ATP-binding protein